uniref:Variant surface glycoprotein 1125.3039 n=1 Tax=Trypanosoma brucei TaxID=5691 RepID=A0A1J0R977_9TRYP|nr:variant surface glycoprotein 1125.3039 [Trypanosoma brucei]
MTTLIKGVKKTTRPNTEVVCAFPAVEGALSATVTCVCSKFGDTHTTDYVRNCHDNNTNGGQRGITKKGYNTTQVVCLKYPFKKLTVELIESKIAALKSIFKTKGDSGNMAMVLGIIGTTHQCKNVANTACTDFTKSSPFKNSDTPEKIAWEVNMRKAAGKLKKADEAAVIQKKTNVALRFYAKRAKEIIRRLLLENRLHLKANKQLQNNSTVISTQQAQPAQQQITANWKAAQRKQETTANLKMGKNRNPKE